MIGQQHNFQHFIVDTPELLASLKNYEAQVTDDLLVLDLESNSEIEKIAQVYGIGLCFTDQKAFYIPWRRKDGTSVWTDTDAKSIIDWIADACKRRRVIGHNILYDVLVFENNFGINLESLVYSDTILMKHTLDENPPFGLKEIAPAILGPWADKAQEKLKENVVANGGKWTKDTKEMYKADTEVLGEYCCWDVMLTLLLFNIFQKKLESEELLKFFYEEEVMPLYKEVTINMKRKGFPIDIAYFEKLKLELTKEINSLEDSILTEIKPLVSKFEQELLDKKFPVKPGGNFPKAFAKMFDLRLPVDKKTGKITLATKALKILLESDPSNKEKVFYEWLLEKNELDTNTWIYTNRAAVQREQFFDDNPDKRYVFNLASGDHMGHLLFNVLGITPFKFTETKKPSTDAEVLDELIEQYKDKEPWMAKLFDLRKLNKLQSTYVEGVLDRQIQGMIYTSMLQFGTTSGRYSSRNPNLQNQPRVKDDDSGLSELVLKYVNAIKKGFIAGAGNKVVNADYASLEPRCFAHMSGDENLRDVFRKPGEDLYSLVGIKTFQLVGYSSNKKDPNYLGEVAVEWRQKSKEFVLMVPYGAEEAQVSRKMGVDWDEARDIIANYLKSFPNLKRYMATYNYSAKKNGYVKTELGRIRHLPEAKNIYNVHGDQVLDRKYAKNKGLLDTRSRYKNLLNNAKNFPIQGLASHIVNRAMIAITREFKRLGIDGWIALQVHDEITCIVAEKHSELAAKIVRDCMENTTKISIPLIAEPQIADNWADSK